MRLGRPLFSAVCLLATATFPACRDSGSSRRESRGCLAARPDRPPFNLLLLTLDTTRADHLRCYGRANAGTPGLDSLARAGVLFENATTAVPLTLPSHATILTGLYPPEHGLRTNGRAALAHDIPTLAESFDAAGYDTAAFIAAFVLDHRFGLNRGFDTYNDDMSSTDNANRSARRIEQQRPGRVVTDAALKWLDQHASRPFFCWVHYFDPHTPYNAPPVFTEHFPDPYDAEIACMDTQIRKLLDFLDRRDLRRRTLIVAVGDHGESLGEHGESTHELYIYGSVMHVPLIFSLPDMLASGARAADLVGAIDIVPTIADLFGWTWPGPLSGRSLGPALLGGSLPPVAYYAESQAAWLEYGCSPLHGAIRGSLRFIDAPRPELYDRSADPAETNNLAAGRPGQLEEMRDELGRLELQMKRGRASTLPVDAATRSKLAALGYFTPSTTSPATSQPRASLRDPKDIVRVLKMNDDCDRLIHDGKLAQAVLTLREAIQLVPDTFMLRCRLAEVHILRSEFDDAVEQLKLAAKLHPDDPEVVTNIGSAYLQLENPSEALRYYEAAHALSPDYSPAILNLARLYDLRRDPRRALDLYQQAVRIDPSPRTLVELGRLHQRLGESVAAGAAMKQAVDRDPSDPNIRREWANWLADQRRLDEAAAQYEQLIRAFPDRLEFRVGLGSAYQQMNRPEQAELCYQAVLDRQPNHRGAVIRLADLRVAGGRADDAIDLLDRLLAAQPSDIAVQLQLHRALLHAGKFSQARNRLTQAIARGNAEPILKLRLATLLAEAPDPTVRSGPEARRIATELLKTPSSDEAAILDALAAAHAECGDFPQAIATAQRALDVARRSNNPELVNRINAHLALVRSHKPIRESADRPPASAPASP